MLNQNFGDWSAFGKAFAAPFAELHNINSRVLEQLSKEHVEMASSNIASAIKHAQTSCKIKDAEDFVKLQMEYLTDLTAKFMGYGKDLGKMIENAGKDYRKWSEDNTADALKKAGFNHVDCCNRKKD